MAYYTIDQNIGEINNSLSQQKTIAVMMHGFGDSSSPNPSTVALVESITLQQMHGIILEAIKNMERRNSDKLIAEDIFFIMRHNKSKLRHLLNYYKVMEVVKITNKMSDDHFIPNVLLEEDDDLSIKKKKNIFHKISDMLDETGSFQDDHLDHSLQERNIRILRMADSLSMDKYKSFREARSATFLKSCRSTKLVLKFKQWLNLNSNLSVKAEALVLLNYLARETVATVVDLAFLVRQDSTRISGDPMSTLEGGNYCNPSSLANSIYIKTGQEGVSPLTVCEVREAMRRFSTQRIGIPGLFVRNVKNVTKLKFLAVE